MNGESESIGNKEKTKVTYTKYNREKLEVKETKILDEILKNDSQHIKWINVIGLEDVDFIEELGNKLGVHHLVMDSILNTSKNSKEEDHEKYLFIVIRSIYPCKDEIDNFETEQISLLLFKNMVISFQNSNIEAFEKIDSRFKKGSHLRNSGADYLLYSLIDYIVDNYFLVIENIGEVVDTMEYELLENPKKDLLERIYNIKKKLVYIRSILWSMRNTVGSLSRNSSNLIEEKTDYYLRDVHDNITETIDIVETYREISSEMHSTYLSSIGNKTNDIMKVLTIFSTIFIPLTFLTGIYGMNFLNFPELGWKYGYASFWVLSLGLILFMLRYFKKKDWF